MVPQGVKLWNPLACWVSSSSVRSLSAHCGGTQMHCEADKRDCSRCYSFPVSLWWRADKLMTTQRQEGAHTDRLLRVPVLIPNTVTALYAMLWISLVTRSCILNLLPNSALTEHLQPGRSESQQGACEALHIWKPALPLLHSYTKANWAYCVLNECSPCLFGRADPKTDINWAVENTHACSSSPWHISFSSSMSCEKSSATGGKWTLSQELTGPYVGENLRQKQHKISGLAWNSPHHWLTCLFAHE